MIRNVFIAALAGTAAIAAPAIAKPGAAGPANTNVGANAHVNSNAGMNAGMNARVNSQGSVNASTNSRLNTGVNSNTNVNAGANARVNSQGPANAAINGVAHANQHSVLANGAVPATTLPGLTTGLTVNNSAGASVGTVSRVVTGTDGTIRMVIVTSSTGQTFRLPANTLTISGGVVTTTSTSVGG